MLLTSLAQLLWRPGQGPVFRSAVVPVHSEGCSLSSQMCPHPHLPLLSYGTRWAQSCPGLPGSLWSPVWTGPGQGLHGTQQNPHIVPVGSPLTPTLRWRAPHGTCYTLRPGPRVHESWSHDAGRLCRAWGLSMPKLWWCQSLTGPCHRCTTGQRVGEAWGPGCLCPVAWQSCLPRLEVSLSGTGFGGKTLGVLDPGWRRITRHPPR